MSVCQQYNRLSRELSFIISYFGFRFNNAYNKFYSVLFGVPVEACCHEQDSLMRGVSSSVCRDKQTPPLSATLTFHAQNVNDTQHSISHRKSWFLPQLACPRRNIAITFGIKNLKWCGYPNMKKVSGSCFRRRRRKEFHRNRLLPLCPEPNYKLR